MPPGQQKRPGVNVINQAISCTRPSATVVLTCSETPLALDAIAPPLRQRSAETNAALARVFLGWWVGGLGAGLKVAAFSCYYFSSCLRTHSLGYMLFYAANDHEAASL